MDDAISCIRMSHAIAVRPILEAVAPVFAQGEAAERPIPVPNASRPAFMLLFQSSFDTELAS